MNTIEVLDSISRCNNNCSDYKIAQLMDVTRSAVSSWRKGKNIMRANNRLRAAKLLNYDPFLLLYYGQLETMQMQNAPDFTWAQQFYKKRTNWPLKTPEWKQFIKTMGGTATAFVLAIIVTMAPQQAEARAGFNNNHQVYTLCELKTLISFIIIKGIFVILALLH